LVFLSDKFCGTNVVLLSVAYFSVPALRSRHSTERIV